MRFKQVFCLLLLTILFTQVFLPFTNAAIGTGYYPLTVDATTYASPLGYYPDNHMSFTATGRNWIFYIDLVSTIKFTSKTIGGTTYLAATTLLVVDGFFPNGGIDVFYNNATGKVSIAVVDSVNFDLLYRLGTPASDGSIAWAATFQTVIDAPAFATIPTDINIISVETPASGGEYYDFISYVRHTSAVSDIDNLHVTKSSTNNGVWTSDFDTILKTGPTNADLIQGTSLNTRWTGTVDVIYYWSNTAKLYAIEWTVAGGWGAIQTGPACANPIFTCVSDPGYAQTIHVSYCTSAPLQDKLWYTTFTGTWQVGTALQNFNLGGILWTPAISGNLYSGDLTLVFQNTTGFYYTNSTLGTWGAIVSIGSDADGATGYPIGTIDEFSWGFRINYYWTSNLNGGSVKTFGIPDPNTWGYITDIDDTTNMYAMKKYYNLQVKGFSINVITQVAAKIYDGTNLRNIVRGDTLNVVPAWTVAVGSTLMNLDTCTWDALSQIANFKIEATWLFPSVVAGETLDYSYVDTGPTNSTWLGGTPFYEVSRLVVDALLGNATNVAPTNWLKVQGNIRYALAEGSNAPSTSYPPDAEFENVQIRDQYNVIWGTDSIIVNGVFSVIFSVNGIGQNQNFYVWVNILAPYVDKLTVDGRYWSVSLISSDAIDAAIATIFSILGLANVWVNIKAALTAFSIYFVSSLSLFVNFITSIVAFVIYGGSALYWWVSTFLTIITSILTSINAIFTGTVGLAGTTINWFTIFFTAQNLNFAAIVLFILWFDGLWLRGKLQGRTYIEVMIGDLQMASFVVGYVTSILYTVFNMVLDFVLRFAGWLLRLI